MVYNLAKTQPHRLHSKKERMDGASYPELFEKEFQTTQLSF